MPNELRSTWTYFYNVLFEYFLLCQKIKRCGLVLKKKVGFFYGYNMFVNFFFSYGNPGPTLRSVSSDFNHVPTKLNKYKEILDCRSFF